MNEDENPVPSLEARAAFQTNTDITDLEFLTFWESMSYREKLDIRINAIRMGFLSIGSVVFRFPDTYIGRVILK